jgi:hypothetical protein
MIFSDEVKFASYPDNIRNMPFVHFNNHHLYVKNSSRVLVFKKQVLRFKKLFEIEIPKES